MKGNKHYSSQIQQDFPGGYMSTTTNTIIIATATAIVGAAVGAAVAINRRSGASLLKALDRANEKFVRNEKGEYVKAEKKEEKK